MVSVTKNYCNGDEEIVKATKEIVISTDTVVVCIGNILTMSPIFAIVTKSFFCVFLINSNVSVDTSCCTTDTAIKVAENRRLLFFWTNQS